MRKTALLGMGLSLLLVTITNCGKNQVPAASGDVSTPELERIVIPADLWLQDIPPEAIETRNLVESTDVPQRDLVKLASQIKNPGQLVPYLSRDKPWAMAIGENHDFWIQDRDTKQYDRAKANLAYETPHAYWFVAEGLNLDADSLAKSAERFEEEIYPANHYYFGEEWSPGVDNDPHLVILLAGGLGEGIGAYQNSLDEYTQAVNPFSNEMEMIYVSASDELLNTAAFDCIIAHEFQHVIQWAVDRDEKTWLNEVFSLLACPLNDLEAEYVDFIVKAFASEPDTPLNVWRTDNDQAAAQYGASHLFGSYLLDRIGGRSCQWLSECRQCPGLIGNGDRCEPIVR
jgi:immune inhibitor A